MSSASDKKLEKKVVNLSQYPLRGYSVADKLINSDAVFKENAQWISALSRAKKVAGTPKQLFEAIVISLWAAHSARTPVQQEEAEKALALLVVRSRNSREAQNLIQKKMDRLQIKSMRYHEKSRNEYESQPHAEPYWMTTLPMFNTSRRLLEILKFAGQSYVPSKRVSKVADQIRRRDKKFRLL